MSQSSSEPAVAGPTASELDPDGIDLLDLGNNVIVALSILYALATIFLVLRLWARFVVLSTYGWDDLFAVLLWAAVTASTGSGLKIVKSNKITGFSSDSNMQPVVDVGVNQATLLTLVLLPFESAFLKLTALCLILRIFPYRVKKPTAILAWIGVALTVLFNTVIFITYCALCVPRGPENTATATSPPLCHAKYDITVSLATNAFNWVADVYILLISIPPVWALGTSAKKKIGVSLVFGTGLATCVASIVTFYYRIISLQLTYDVVLEYKALIAQFAELTVGSIATSLPSVKALSAYSKDKRAAANSYRGFSNLQGSEQNEPKDRSRPSNARNAKRNHFSQNTLFYEDRAPINRATQRDQYEAGYPMEHI